jgi:glycosyltransferase involved in cell wall biosynthesis
LRIALDATPLRQAIPATGFRAASGGVGRYTAQLALALAAEFPEDEFLLLSDQPFQLPAGDSGLPPPNLRAGKPPASFLERRWWMCGLPRELKRRQIDLFQGCDFAVPFPSPVPSILTLHDLSPWRNDPWADAAWRARTARIRQRVPWLLRLRAAAHVITPSEAIRDEAIRLFRLPADRVTATPLAPAPQFRPLGAPPERPYFLFVGMLEPRKNVRLLLDAWAAVRAAHDVDLVIAGPRREEVHPPEMRPGIVCQGEVTDDRLAELYTHAIAFVYPSRYEGFGLPVIEAMQCGAPVILSRDPALRETAGDAALYAGSAPELAAAMLALLENAELRADLQARSFARARLFTWQKTARRTHQIYRKVLAA